MIEAMGKTADSQPEPEALAEMTSIVADAASDLGRACTRFLVQQCEAEKRYERLVKDRLRLGRLLMQAMKMWPGSGAKEPQWRSLLTKAKIHPGRAARCWNAAHESEASGESEEDGAHRLGRIISKASTVAKRESGRMTATLTSELDAEVKKLLTLIYKLPQGAARLRWAKLLRSIANHLEDEATEHLLYGEKEDPLADAGSSASG